MQNSIYVSAFGPSDAVSFGWTWVSRKSELLVLRLKMPCRMLPARVAQPSSSPEPDRRIPRSDPGADASGGGVVAAGSAGAGAASASARATDPFAAGAEVPCDAAGAGAGSDA